MGFVNGETKPAVKYLRRPIIGVYEINAITDKIKRGKDSKIIPLVKENKLDKEEKEYTETPEDEEDIENGVHIIDPEKVELLIPGALKVNSRSFFCYSLIATQVGLSLEALRSFDEL